MKSVMAMGLGSTFPSVIVITSLDCAIASVGTTTLKIKPISAVNTLTRAKTNFLVILVPITTELLNIIKILLDQTGNSGFSTSHNLRVIMVELMDYTAGTP